MMVSREELLEELACLTHLEAGAACMLVQPGVQAVACKVMQVCH